MVIISILDAILDTRVFSCSAKFCENWTKMSHLSSPDALNIYQQHLGYNQLKWSGSGNVLSNFIRFILDEIGKCSITTAEDHTHNLISYKAKDVIVKWYTVTKTLLIHASFREKML